MAKNKENDSAPSTAARNYLPNLSSFPSYLNFPYYEDVNMKMVLQQYWSHLEFEKLQILQQQRCNDFGSPFFHHQGLQWKRNELKFLTNQWNQLNIRIDMLQNEISDLERTQRSGTPTSSQPMMTAGRATRTLLRESTDPRSSINVENDEVKDVTEEIISEGKDQRGSRNAHIVLSDDNGITTNNKGSVQNNNSINGSADTTTMRSESTVLNNHTEGISYNGNTKIEKSYKMTDAERKRRMKNKPKRLKLSTSRSSTRKKISTKKNISEKSEYQDSSKEGDKLVGKKTKGEYYSNESNDVSYIDNAVDNAKKRRREREKLSFHDNSEGIIGVGKLKLSKDRSNMSYTLFENSGYSSFENSAYSSSSVDSGTKKMRSGEDVAIIDEPDDGFYSSDDHLPCSRMKNSVARHNYEPDYYRSKHCHRESRERSHFYRSSSEDNNMQSRHHRKNIHPEINERSSSTMESSLIRERSICRRNRKHRLRRMPDSTAYDEFSYERPTGNYHDENQYYDKRIRSHSKPHFVCVNSNDAEAASRSRRKDPRRSKSEHRKGKEFKKKQSYDSDFEEQSHTDSREMVVTNRDETRQRRIKKSQCKSRKQPQSPPRRKQSRVDHEHGRIKEIVTNPKRARRKSRERRKFDEDTEIDSQLTKSNRKKKFLQSRSHRESDGSESNDEDNYFAISHNVFDAKNSVRCGSSTKKKIASEFMKGKEQAVNLLIPREKREVKDPVKKKKSTPRKKLLSKKDYETPVKRKKGENGARISSTRERATTLKSASASKSRKCLTSGQKSAATVSYDSLAELTSPTPVKVSKSSEEKPSLKSRANATELATVGGFEDDVKSLSDCDAARETVSDMEVEEEKNSFGPPDEIVSSKSDEADKRSSLLLLTDVAPDTMVHVSTPPQTDTYQTDRKASAAEFARSLRSKERYILNQAIREGYDESDSDI